MITPTSEDVLTHAVRQASVLRPRWGRTPLRDRLRLIRRMRHILAREAHPLAGLLTAALPQRRSVAETLAAEVLPLLEGWRFLERQAEGILKPRRLGARGRPTWLWGAQSTIYREPKGTVLILCPFNYPLLLGGAPMGQALAAGNTVLLKPGRLGREAAELLVDLAERAGVPRGVVQVLDNSIEAGLDAIDLGVDHVVMTGSSEAGRAVMRQCARSLTPLTMELSGCDAVFVREDADVSHVARCLVFGSTINSGATCIAPRRVWVHRLRYKAVCEAVTEAMRPVEPMQADPVATERLRELAEDACRRGARRLVGSIGEDGRMTPLVLADVTPDAALLRQDVFAPGLALVPVESDDQAITFDTGLPFALGASVFGSAAGAAQLAERVEAGVVTVNDLIVPTADPRLPFGGRGHSGFGVTRGAEGLLELTRIRTVTHRPPAARFHLQPPRDDDAHRLTALIQSTHSARWSQRMAAVRQLIRFGR